MTAQEEGKWLLDICDILREVVAKAERGGLLDIMPYAQRIREKAEEVKDGSY